MFPLFAPIINRSDYRYIVPLVAILLIATAYRLYLLNTAFAYVDSDQAVLGLMANHILQGERPVFYYGQSYMGSAEAYVTAIVFALWGASDLTLRLVPLMCSVLFAGLVYTIGYRHYNSWVALLGGLFVALGPAVLINWSTVAGAGYVEIMVIGATLFLLAEPLLCGHALSVVRVSILSLLIGLGLWIEPMIVLYLVPLGVVAMLRWRWVRRTSAHGGTTVRSVGLPTLLSVAAGGVLLGSAPLWLYNAPHGWPTITYLMQPSPLPLHRLNVAGQTLIAALPVLLGAATPNSVPAYFWNDVHQHPVQYDIGLLLSILIVVRLIGDPRAIWLRLRSLPTRRVIPDSYLALFVLIVPALFIMTRFGGLVWSTTQPRYLLPLYTATPFVLAVFLPSVIRMRARLVSGIVVGLLILVGVVTTLQTRPRMDVTPLVTLLDRHHIRAVYTDYWIANRLTFESDEHVVGIAIDGHLSPGNNRYLPYIRKVQQIAPRQTAWIVSTPSPAELTLRHWLVQNHAHYYDMVWQQQQIVWDVTPQPRVRIMALQ